MNNRAADDRRQTAFDERKKMITPEQARTRMPTQRQRAAKAVADEIENLIEVGNPNSVIVMPFDDLDDNAVIAELLEYQKAGWNVEFYRGCAAISLPEVVS